MSRASKVIGVRVEDLAGHGLVVKQRYRMPLKITVPWLIVTTVVRWAWVLLVWAVRTWRLSAPVALLAWAWSAHGVIGVVLVVAVLTVGGIVLRYVAPDVFVSHVSGRVRGAIRRTLKYRHLWVSAMDGLNLTRTTGDSLYAPRVRYVSSTKVVDRLRVKLLHGQTPEDLAGRAEPLRHALGAARATVTEVRPGVVDVSLFSLDVLADVIPALVLNDKTRLRVKGLPIGIREDGLAWRLRLVGTHVLIAGAMGSGKGSVQASIIRALIPGVRSGVVTLIGIDPKGVELFLGRACFAELADDGVVGMVELLEATAADMQERLKGMKLAGLRVFKPSVSTPLVVIMIDELAALLAYCTDRALKARATAALSIILTQGRAPGFVVVASVQDPRKDIVSLRDLFPTRIALRTTEAEHADMILGDGAQNAGALCHLIPESTPGVGYVRLDGHREPMRVRSCWVDDQDIADTVAFLHAEPVDVAPEVIDLTEQPTGSSVRVPVQGGRDRS